MMLNAYDAIPCEITLDATALGRVPNAIRNHVRNGGKLYLVERPENGHAVISIDPDPTCAPCTYLSESHVTVAGQDRDPRDLSFVEVGAKVWYIFPACKDTPVRPGEVTEIDPDGSVELWDDFGHLGSVDFSINDLYATEEEANEAFSRR